MEKKQKTALVIGGFGLAGGITLALLASRKGGDGDGGNGEEPWLGVSLKIINAPSGAYYWATDWGVLELDKTLWWDTVPDINDIEIRFLDADLNNIGADVECAFSPEPGMHYILDISNCTLIENPDPEEPPEYEDPALVSYDIPDVMQLGQSYPAQLTVYLPNPWQSYPPMYVIRLDITELSPSSLDSQDAYPFIVPDSVPDFYLDEGPATYTLDFLLNVVFDSHDYPPPAIPGDFALRVRIAVCRMWPDGNFGQPCEYYDFYPKVVTIIE